MPFTGYKRKRLGRFRKRVFKRLRRGARRIRRFGIKPRIRGIHAFTRETSVWNRVSGNIASSFFSAVAPAPTLAADQNNWTYTLGGGGYCMMSHCLQVTMDMLPSVSEFSVLFDQYRINGLRLTIEPFLNNVDGSLVAAQGQGTNVSGFLHSWRDNDSESAVVASGTTVDTIKQYQSYKRMRLFTGRSKFRMFVKPSLLLPVTDETQVLQNAIRSRPRWLDFSFTSLEHLGINFAMELYNVTASQQVSFKVELKYYFQCRDVR